MVQSLCYHFFSLDKNIFFFWCGDPSALNILVSRIPPQDMSSGPHTPLPIRKPTHHRQILPAAHCHLISFWSKVPPRRWWCTYVSRGILLTRYRAVLQSTGLAFCSVTPTWVLQYFLMTRLRLCVVGRKTPKWCCALHSASIPSYHY